MSDTIAESHDSVTNTMAAQNSLQFKSTATMIDHLTSISPLEISKIRQIHLKSFPFPVYTEEDMSSYFTYMMGSTLALFPGLGLDLLTAEDPFHDPGVNDGWGDVGTYLDIETLINSDGWKELHYFSPTTEFMASRADSQKHRVAQPAGWDELLKKKDGENSGAGVKMFIAKEPGLSAAYPRTSMAYEAVPGHLLPVEKEGRNAVDARGVLVVAKRGRYAKYVQYGSQVGSDFDEKLKGLWTHMSWQEIKESERYVPPESDPCAHL